MDVGELAKFRGGASVDNISELTNASGVTIDSVLLKDGSAQNSSFYGTEPGAVSSSTSGQAGTAVTASRSDHNHDLGAHTHTDATNGGLIVAASATQQGAVTTGAQTFAGKKTFTTPMQAQVVQSGIAAGSSTCDASAYDTFVKTGSSSATNIGLNNLFEGQTITVLINTVASQAAITWKRGTDSAGVADVKWNGGVIPTPTTTGSRYDRYIFQMIGGVIFGSADMNCY